MYPGVKKLSPNVAWELETAHPALWAKAQSAMPWLLALRDELRRGIPAQAQPAETLDGPLIRLSRHYRVIQVDLARTRGGEGFLTIKGTEAAAADFSALVRGMKEISSLYRWSIGHPGSNGNLLEPTISSLLERYALWERKVPGALLLSEALEEAARSAEAQSRYIERYGELARLPLPLLVHHFEEGVTERVLDALRGHLSEEAFATTSARANGGLGVLVYWYGRLSNRASHIDAPSVGPTVSVWDRLEHLKRLGDPRTITSRWIELTARLLGLGLVAADPAAAGRGSAVDAQNLVLDGGMVDLGSLRPMETIERYPEVRHAVERTIIVLADSIATFMFGDALHGRSGFQPDHVRPVWAEVLRACELEQAQGHHLPLPISSLLTERPSFDVLLERFAEFQELSR